MSEFNVTETRKVLSFQELEEIVNQILINNENKGLTDLERIILTGIYENKSYKEMGWHFARGGFSESTLKNTASHLFKRLNKSQVLAEPVTKKNLVGVLNRYRNEITHNIQSLDSQTELTSQNQQNTNNRMELVIEGLSLDDLTEENAKKLNKFIEILESSTNVKLKINFTELG